MKHLIALTAITLLFISSCKKDVVELEPIIPPSAIYMPLTIGSYWVYQDYLIDSLGNSTIMQTRDSMYVAHDTLINGKSYSVLKGRFFPHGVAFLPDSTVMIVRDSSGFMVDYLGNILYASQIIPDTLDSGVTPTSPGKNDTLFYWYQIMDQNTHTISVPAGSFSTLDCKTHYTIFPQSPKPIEQLNHRYISENVGIIIETWSYSSQSAIGSYIEKRLINYHIAN